MTEIQGWYLLGAVMAVAVLVTKETLPRALFCSASLGFFAAGLTQVFFGVVQ